MATGSLVVAGASGDGGGSGGGGGGRRKCGRDGKCCSAEMADCGNLSGSVAEQPVGVDLERKGNPEGYEAQAVKLEGEAYTAYHCEAETTKPGAKQQQKKKGALKWVPMLNAQGVNLVRPRM